MKDYHVRLIKNDLTYFDFVTTADSVAQACEKVINKEFMADSDCEIIEIHISEL